MKRRIMNSLGSFCETTRQLLLAVFSGCLGFASNLASSPDQPPQTTDVVVYGGTSAGIAAAIQVKRMGKSVLLIEPSGHLGGLTTANHPRVPQSIRDEVALWGMCQDEFIDGNGWQSQLYIREARRMVGDLVMTQHHCQGRQIADDSVGLAAYTMDSHHVRRHIDSHGFVRNEGDVQVRGFPPYPIGYRAIVPRGDQCSNLLVPVCLSASHIAFGSIRMEPVFMVLGQSAATAAAQAIDQQVSVQQIDSVQLRQQLLADGMVLEWQPTLDPSSHLGVDAKELEGIVLDDNAAKMQGFDSVSRFNPRTSTAPISTSTRPILCQPAVEVRWTKVVDRTAHAFKSFLLNSFADGTARVVRPSLTLSRLKAQNSPQFRSEPHSKRTISATQLDPPLTVSSRSGEFRCMSLVSLLCFFNSHRCMSFVYLCLPKTA
jgi:hypothetical protein